MSILPGILGQVKQPDAPIISFVSKTASSLTWKIDNYDPGCSYSFSGSGLFGSIDPSTFNFTQSGLSAGTQYSVSATATQYSIVGNSSTSISKYTTPAQPTIIIASQTLTGVVFEIDNYSTDPNYSYSVSVTPGNFTRSGKTITVTGLSEGQSCTVLVTVTVDSTSSTNFLTALGTVSIQYLVIAGGGGGGRSTSPPNTAGGGGGGGGFLEGTSAFQVSTNIPVTIGAGGAGGTNSSLFYGTNGSDSVIGSIVAKGGGGGAPTASTGNNGSPGGSGGGGAAAATSTTFYFLGSGGSGTPGQGTPGKSGGGVQSPGSPVRDYWGGGGGGAGTTGGDGYGGAAKASSITGSSVTYSGGGGGGYYTFLSPGGFYFPGGEGAGRGAYIEDYATNASPGRGGGGGGGMGNNYAGNGGSGRIVLKMPTSRNAGFVGGLTVSLNTISGYKIYTITAGSGTVNFS